MEGGDVYIKLEKPEKLLLDVKEEFGVGVPFHEEFEEGYSKYGDIEAKEDAKPVFLMPNDFEEDCGYYAASSPPGEMKYGVPEPATVKTEESGKEQMSQSSIKARIVRQSSYLCSLCNIVFPNEQTYMGHINSKHKDLYRYPCRHCGKRFAKIEQRKTHETIHDPNRYMGEPQFQCSKCDKKYHLKRGLQSHFRKAHRGYIPPKRKATTSLKMNHHSRGVRQAFVRKPKPEYPCPHCDLKFEMLCNLKKHSVVHTRERNFVCHICQQPCASKGCLRTHIRDVHETQRTGPRPSRPRFMANQLCPCTVCGAVFKTPARLTRHTTLHTGEKSYECDHCGMKFRLQSGLHTHLKRHKLKQKGIRNIYKCLICGKNNFIMFNDFYNHRIKTHSQIPYNSEAERPFACSVCGKPYATKERAIICTVLRHDPTTLYDAMFKFKCPECPEESLGHRNLVVLREHWNAEHSNIPLPVKFRAGMYSENVKDSLPTISVSKDKIKELLENGPPKDLDLPLYREFDLLPIDKELLKRKRKTSSRSTNLTANQKPECTVCGLVLSTKSNMKRHMLTHTVKNGVCAITCDTCGKTFRKRKALVAHKKLCKPAGHRGLRGRRGKMRLIAEDINDTNAVLQNVVIKCERLKGSCTDGAVDNQIISINTVHLENKILVRQILGSKRLKIILSRCDS